MHRRGAEDELHQWRVVDFLDLVFLPVVPGLGFGCRRERMGSESTGKRAWFGRQ